MDSKQDARDVTRAKDMQEDEFEAKAIRLKFLKLEPLYIYIYKLYLQTRLDLCQVVDPSGNILADRIQVQCNLDSSVSQNINHKGQHFLVHFQLFIFLKTNF